MSDRAAALSAHPTLLQGQGERRPGEWAPEDAAPVVRPLRSGEACPNCHTGRLDYDGLLNLTCPACGYGAGAGGCFS